jgi:NDP-sugar pyrophosphorylase family protein
LHHDAEKIERFLITEQHDGVLAGCEVTSIVEDRPLGTGGAVANAVNNGLLNGRFLVANADTWLGSGIGELARANAPAICAVHVTNTDRYGQMRLRGGKVDAFLEKTTGAGEGWINAGLYLLDANVFSGWTGSAMSIEQDLFPRLAKSGVLGVVTVEADFIDIGIPEDYHRFCRWIESSRATNL